MKVFMAILLFITLISSCFTSCIIPLPKKNECQNKGLKAYCKEKKILIFIRKCKCGCKN